MTIEHIDTKLKKGYRLCKTDDFESIAFLDSLEFPGCELENFIDTHAWIYWLGDEVAGFCTLKDCGQGIGFLSRCAVLPFHRGQGLQAKMIKKRFTAACELNMDVVITYTVHNNVPSNKNLQRCKFELYAPQYEWAGSDKLYWQRKIK
jgi:RimJ/RimL family protein N-acetyltransferase